MKFSKSNPLVASARAVSALAVCLAFVGCGGGGGGSGGGGSEPPPPPAQTVTVSGRIAYQRVPFAALATPTARGGLDHPATFEAPAREVVVELLQSPGLAVLATTTTGTDGRYSFTAPANSNVVVRAKALSRVTASASRPGSWDVRVLDNTSGDALYTLDSSVIATGAADVVRNLTAATGWSGGSTGSYTGARAAAPFAILDTLYEATQQVLREGDATLALQPLRAYWSPRNRPFAGDAASGDIGTTLYRDVENYGSESGIYVLGDATVDTDEFDRHVVAHEYFHFLEDVVGREDGVGGSHSLDERLDPRVAFSEGYANAYSAMVTGDPLYRDSFESASGGGDGRFSVEGDPVTAPGWYSEGSVQRIVWDLYDAANDSEDVDDVTLGFRPLFDVFRTELAEGPALTMLFPFVTALKQRPGVPVTAIDARVEAERLPRPPEQPGPFFGIDAARMDAYATGESHGSVGAESLDLVLPVYTPLALNALPVRVCSSSQLITPSGAAVSGSYNKLGNRRFLRFDVPGPRAISIVVDCPATDPTCVGGPVPDPDLVLWQAGVPQVAESETAFTERLDVNVQAGTHVLEVYEYSHVDPADTARRGRTCLTVTITG